MAKLFEVKEFDRITGNSEFQDYDGYKYIEEPYFNCLTDFIKEFTAGEEQSDVLDFMCISYRRNIGDIVTIRNYVGLIQMRNGCQIQVLPKINLGNKADADNAETKRIFLKMLKSMKDFPSKVFSDANIRVDKMNMYEIFINMYLQEVRQLVKKGIKSSYVELEDNLRYYRGKLLTNQHIKQNMSHRERFYMSYDEFNPDISENRIVKATLQKLQQLTTSAENSKEISQLLNYFDGINPSINHDKEFARIKMDRSMEDYITLMQWSRVFLQNKSFTTFSGRTVSRALLFPMEKVFESYVAQNLRKIMGKDGWETTVQDKGFYLFTEPYKQFALRPDIVCRKGNRTVILDTKWKNLTDNYRINYGIQQADMYQMYAYSKKYKTSEIWLLYPTNKEMEGLPEIKFESGDDTVVRLHFVDVADIEESLDNLRKKLV